MSLGQEPLVTVLTPVYNGDDLLAKLSRRPRYFTIFNSNARAGNLLNRDLYAKRIPRILYVTRIWPSECGAHVRSLNILRALQQIGHVEVIGLEGIGSSSSADSDFEFTHTFRFELRSNRGLPLASIPPPWLQLSK